MFILYKEYLNIVAILNTIVHIVRAYLNDIVYGFSNIGLFPAQTESAT